MSTLHTSTATVPAPGLHDDPRIKTIFNLLSDLLDSRSSAAAPQAASGSHSDTDYYRSDCHHRVQPSYSDAVSNTVSNVNLYSVPLRTPPAPGDPPTGRYSLTNNNHHAGVSHRIPLLPTPVYGIPPTSRSAGDPSAMNYINQSRSSKYTPDSGVSASTIPPLLTQAEIDNARSARAASHPAGAQHHTSRVVPPPDWIPLDIVSRGPGASASTVPPLLTQAEIDNVRSARHSGPTHHTTHPPGSNMARVSQPYRSDHTGSASGAHSHTQLPHRPTQGKPHSAQFAPRSSNPDFAQVVKTVNQLVRLLNASSNWESIPHVVDRTIDHIPASITPPLSDHHFTDNLERVTGHYKFQIQRLVMEHVTAKSNLLIRQLRDLDRTDYDRAKDIVTAQLRRSLPRLQSPQIDRYLLEISDRIYDLPLAQPVPSSSHPPPLITAHSPAADPPSHNGVEPDSDTDSSGRQQPPRDPSTPPIDVISHPPLPLIDLSEEPPRESDTDTNPNPNLNQTDSPSTSAMDVIDQHYARLFSKRPPDLSPPAHSTPHKKAKPTDSNHTTPSTRQATPSPAGAAAAANCTSDPHRDQPQTTTVTPPSTSTTDDPLPSTILQPPLPANTASTSISADIHFTTPAPPPDLPSPTPTCPPTPTDNNPLHATLTSFSPNNKTQWTIPDIDRHSTVLVIADSNGRRLAQHAPADWHIASYSGAHFSHVYKLLCTSTIPTHLRAVIIAVGLNDRMKHANILSHLTPLQTIIHRQKVSTFVSLIPHFEEEPLFLKRGTLHINSCLRDLFPDPTLVPLDLVAIPDSTFDVDHYVSTSAGQIIDFFTLHLCNNTGYALN